MKPIFIVLIILGGILVLFILFWLIRTLFEYKKEFKRVNNPSLLDLDLTNTHYASYIDIIYQNIVDFKALPWENVEITSDGLKLKARYYHNNSDNTVIFVHGYQAQAFNNFPSSSKSFLKHNYNILLIDQRAHNDSEGKYTSVGLKEQYDVLEWIKYITNNTNTKNIILYGVSMGAATLGYLSNKLKDTKVRAIIMDCGFISFYDEVYYVLRKKKYDFIVAGLLRMWAYLHQHIDIKKTTLDSLKESDVPVYFIHGTSDGLVPVEHSIAAYNSCRADKKIHYVLGAGHTTGFMIDYEFLDQDVFLFINKYLK